MPDCSPDSESGAIEGELHLEGDGSSAGSILYLGEYAGLETTNPIVVLDPARDMHVTTNEEGRFCLSKVPPGTYSLIVWNAGESVLLKDPSTEDHSLQLEVEAGETLETGILYTPYP
ncbi:MAG: carboxypeptidase-like regulatory domain-containing protein [Anaerolineales bacterium]